MPREYDPSKLSTWPRAKLIKLYRSTRLAETLTQLRVGDDEWKTISVIRADLRHDWNSFQRLRLENHNFRDTRMPRNCYKANFRGCWLTRTDFSNTTLSEANLRGAAFNETNFRGAHLDDADLSYSDLTKADFTGADLTGATLPTGMTIAQWAQVKNIETIIGLPMDLVAAVEAYKARVLNEKILERLQTIEANMPRKTVFGI